MISFIHTGDWHIGKSFSAFGEKAGELASARLSAIDRIAVAARGEGAPFVLVAGDTFHSPSLDVAASRQPIARMKGHPDIRWHIISGNHDPAGCTVWRRLGAEGLPANVILHSGCEPVEIAPGAFLLPCPLVTKFATDDPTMSLDAVVTPPGAVRIGLAHGAVQSFGGAEARGTIAIDRAERAGLTYLALGDWHGVKEVGSRAWYAGTPEPDGFPDNVQGWSLSVRIDGATAPPRVAQHRTALFDWRRYDLAVRSPRDLDTLVSEVDRAGADAARFLIRLELNGMLGHEGDAAIGVVLDRLAAHVFHLERRLDGLRPSTETGEDAALPTEDLRWVARHIAEQAGQDGARSAIVAARALRLLHTFARDAVIEARA